MSGNESASSLSANDNLMQEKRERARQRRRAEEAHEDAARQERFKVRLVELEKQNFHIGTPFTARPRGVLSFDKQPGFESPPRSKPNTMAATNSVDRLIIQLMARAHAPSVAPQELQDAVLKLPSAVYEERAVFHLSMTQLTQKVAQLHALNAGLHDGLYAPQTGMTSQTPQVPGSLSRSNTTTLQNTKMEAPESEVEKLRREISKLETTSRQQSQEVIRLQAEVKASRASEANTQRKLQEVLKAQRHENPYPMALAGFATNNHSHSPVPISQQPSVHPRSGGNINASLPARDPRSQPYSTSPTGLRSMSTRTTHPQNVSQDREQQNSAHSSANRQQTFESSDVVPRKLTDRIVIKHPERSRHLVPGSQEGANETAARDTRLVEYDHVPPGSKRTSFPSVNEGHAKKFKGENIDDAVKISGITEPYNTFGDTRCSPASGPANPHVATIEEIEGLQAQYVEAKNRRAALGGGGVSSPSNHVTALRTTGEQIITGAPVEVTTTECRDSVTATSLTSVNTTKPHSLQAICLHCHFEKLECNHRWPCQNCNAHATRCVYWVCPAGKHCQSETCWYSHGRIE